LLPAGKVPRLAISAALLVAILLVLDLETVLSAKSLFFSNALDLAMILLAAICSFYVARRSSGYARQPWTLLTAALSLESIAQAISTYYQSFVPGSAEIPRPSDLLFFVWATPVFMMFLPSSDDNSPAIDWLRVLDFLQVTIVAATAYLYFFYVPSRWQSDHASLLRQILILYIVRDFLLAAGFFLRARTSLSPWLRYFSAAMAVFFLIAVLSDGDYLSTLGTYSGAASWGDFVSALPYLFVIIFAATWKPAAEGPVHEPRSRFGDFVLTHILPTGIPLLVILMGRRIAKEQLLIAWIAVAASFLCSALRLSLTNRKQQRVSRELHSTELALRRSEHIFASAFRWSPDSFSINVFPNGPYLDVNEGFTRLTGYSREETRGKTPSQMNLWTDPPSARNFSLNSRKRTNSADRNSVSVLDRATSAPVKCPLSSPNSMDAPAPLSWFAISPQESKPRTSSAPMKNASALSSRISMWASFSVDPTPGFSSPIGPRQRYFAFRRSASLAKSLANSISPL
jgi:PAS domain-containing protein